MYLTYCVEWEGRWVKESRPTGAAVCYSYTPVHMNRRQGLLMHDPSLGRNNTRRIITTNNHIIIIFIGQDLDCISNQLQYISNQIWVNMIWYNKYTIERYYTTLRKQRSSSMGQSWPLRQQHGTILESPSKERAMWWMWMCAGVYPQYQYVEPDAFTRIPRQYSTE